MSQTPESYGPRRLHNFRNVAGYTTEDGRKMKSGMLFRSATPTDATEEERNHLLNDCKIKTWIDFRSLQEVKTVHKAEMFGKLTESFSNVFVRPDGDFKAPAGATRVRYAVNIGKMSTRALAFYAWKHTNFIKKIILFILLVLCQFKRAKLIASKSILSGISTLHELYYEIINSGKVQIGQTLRQFAKKENYPMHVNCLLGKDRTGIFIALIMASIGIKREHILKEYAKTRQMMSADEMKFYLHKQSPLAPDSYADAPEEEMDLLFKYLEQNYGSVDKFLDSIGVDATWRHQMKDCLLE
jgi:protein-tyrosine phosphatase